VREREKRIESVEALERQVRDVLDGHCMVSCHVTLTKRATHEFLHWVDRNPKTYTFLLGGVVLSILAGLGFLGVHAVRAL
jgi:hypothetical protein